MSSKKSISSEFQPTFNFRDAPSSFIAEAKTLAVNDIRRAVLAWLAQGHPTGVGLLAPTRISRFLADVAAFWSKPVKRARVKTFLPVKTVIVETRDDREACWPDCARKDELLPILRKEKEHKKSIEADIRANEPDLKNTDTLFAEFESWDYKRTKDKRFHKSVSKIEEIERALYNGSRFEKIRRAMLADLLYLAVPTGSVHPNELADGWGLLYVNDSLEVEMVKEADNWECPVENKLHLVQTIALSCVKNVLFANGVDVDAEGKVKLRRPPRRRRGS